MYKRIINIISLLISLICMIRFTYLANGDTLLIISLPLLYVITILLFMYKGNKGHIYNIITLLFMFISIGIFIIILLENGLVINPSIVSLIIVFSIYGLITMNIVDFKKDVCKTNFILTIIVSLIMIFVFIRYILNYDVLNNISINYIYIMIVSLSLLVHYFVNRKKTL